MRIALYILRRFLAALLFVYGPLLILYLLVESQLHLVWLARFDIGVAGAIGFALYKIAGELYSILPVVAAFAAMLASYRLASCGETTVMRANGLSTLTITGIMAGWAAVVGATAVAAINPFIAISANHYETELRKIGARTDSPVWVFSEILWYQFRLNSSDLIIRASKVDAEGTRLEGADFFLLDSDGALDRWLTAESAVLEEEGWFLENGSQWNLPAHGDTQTMKSTRFDRQKLNTPLTSEQLQNVFSPMSISIWRMRQVIDSYSASGISTIRHLIHLHSELAKPLLMAAMAFVGAVFMMQSQRLGGVVRCVILGTLTIPIVFFSQSTALTFAETDKIMPALAAWGPPAAALLVASYLVISLEEG